MQARYRYRVYPDAPQRHALARAFGCARVVFNDSLRLRDEARQKGEKLSDTEVQRQVVTLAKLTQERQWLGEVASVALVQACQDARRAYRNWFDSLAGKRKGRRVGRPQFRRKHGRQSIRLTRNGFSLHGARLYVAKVGDLKVRWSRSLPSVPSSVTVIREPDGRYYASFVAERDARPLSPCAQEIGIDLGLTHLAVLSDGTKIAAPRFLRKAERPGLQARADVKRRRYARIAVLGAALTTGCLLLAFWIVSARDAAAHAASSAVLLTPRAGHPATGGPRSQPRNDMVAVDAPLSACEARIEGQRDQLPTLAIVGASYTAGVGPDNPELSWAVRLARLLHWNAVIDGVSGAGYVHPGDDGRGPMEHLLGQEDLRGLRPSLVIVQAGHDDVGSPPAVERARVSSAISLVRDAVPGARIALLTTFASTPQGTPALHQTDYAIVSAGAAADPGVIIMDPLAGRWAFARAADGLHPTAAGDQWIARQVESILLAHGLRAAAATATAPVICDVSVGAGKPRAVRDLTRPRRATATSPGSG